MPSRLAHKKSRNGCQRCKARRVKCDEAHPVCGHCSRHSVECIYLPVKEKKETTPKENSQGAPQSIGESSGTSTSLARSPSYSYIDLHSPYSDSSEDPMSIEDRRHLEVRLLHHFITVVTYTFPSSTNPFIRDMWNIDAVRLGFQHEFLLNAIFAITTLHLVRNIPESPRFGFNSETDQFRARILDGSNLPLGNIDPAKAHRIYLNLAVRQQREAIGNLSKESANAVILSSILISYQGLKLQPEDFKSANYSPPTQWLTMTNAINHITTVAAPLIKENNVAVFLGEMSQEPDFRDRAAIFNPENGKVFANLLDFTNFPEADGNTPDMKAAYEKTVDYIGGVYRALVNGEGPRWMFRRILTIGPLVPTQFITYIEERRPRALAILAHHCAIAMSIDDHWLFHGFARREVTGIQGLMPPEWQWAMKWPLAMLERKPGDVAPLEYEEGVSTF